MIAPTAIVDETAVVHLNAAIWHHSVLLAHVVVGDHCSVGSFCEIGRGTIIGAHSRIGSFTFLPSNSFIGKRVFIGPHVMCCDDRHPYVRDESDRFYVAEPPTIEDDAVIGAGSVLLPGVRVGRGARIAAGSLVTKDVRDGGFVRGKETAAIERVMPATWSTPFAEDAGVGHA